MRAYVLRRAAIVGTTEVYTNQRETAERKKTERRIKTKKNLQINRLYKIEFSWSFSRILALCCWVFVVAGGECCAPVVCCFIFFLSSFYFVTLAFIYCTQTYCLSLSHVRLRVLLHKIIFNCLMPRALCANTEKKKPRATIRKFNGQPAIQPAMARRSFTHMPFGMDSKWIIIIIP